MCTVCIYDILCMLPLFKYVNIHRPHRDLARCAIPGAWFRVPVGPSPHPGSITSWKAHLSSGDD